MISMKKTIFRYCARSVAEATVDLERQCSKRKSALHAVTFVVLDESLNLFIEFSWNYVKVIFMRESLCMLSGNRIPWRACVVSITPSFYIFQRNTQLHVLARNSVSVDGLRRRCEQSTSRNICILLMTWGLRS